MALPKFDEGSEQSWSGMQFCDVYKVLAIMCFFMNTLYLNVNHAKSIVIEDLQNHIPAYKMGRSFMKSMPIGKTSRTKYVYDIKLFGDYSFHCVQL